MSGRIEPLRRSQLDRVMDIWLRSNRSAHAFVPGEYWERMAPQVAAALPQAEVLVHLDEDGEVDGFLGLTGGYVAGLFVEQSRRSHGVGRLLLEQAMARRESLELDVFVRNERAVAFYRRHGFVTVEEREHPQLGEPELRMRWQDGLSNNAVNPGKA